MDGWIPLRPRRVDLLFLIRLCIKGYCGWFGDSQDELAHALVSAHEGVVEIYTESLSSLSTVLESIEDMV